MGNQERFDCRRDRVGTLEEAIVTGAGDHDELTLWDRIGDRCRRRNRNGVIFAVDDKGWANNAA